MIDFSADQLYKSFGAKEVLKGVSLQSHSGSALGLLGRNGAGKTTTIRIVMDVFPPDSGRILVNGAPIRRDKMRIGYLPEERGLYAKNQITEQLVYLARLRGMNVPDAKKSISFWLDRLGMGEYANKKLDILSKGNQQKIQLAAALIADPDFIILDEPFSGLDPVNATLLKDVVKEQIAAGKVVLFSSHQMNYVEEFCDHIAILNDGKIVLDGNLDQIKRSYDRKKMMIRCVDSESVLQYCNYALSSFITHAETVEGAIYVNLVSEERKNDLLLALAQQRFDLDSIEVFEPSLNDIFVEYTGDEAEAEHETV